ncbi:MAG: hypothetical protein AAGD04_04395 [Pseudomonadota bacterium]
MSQKDDAIAAAREGLVSLLHCGKLPESKQSTAQTILDKFDAPLRISVLGCSGIDMNGVVNLLAGEDVLLESAPFNTAKFAYSADETLDVVLSDGTKKSFVAPLENVRILDANVPMAEFCLDLPALKKISLLKSDIPPANAERALHWVSEQSDIAIWCTEAFAADEQAAWATVPDKMRDNSFLLRLGAETLEGRRGEVEQRLRDRFEDDFDHVLCLSTRDALAAKAAEPIDKALFKASGASQFISTIKKYLDRYQQHYLDQADVFVLEHADLIAQEPEEDLVGYAKGPELKDEAPEESVNGSDQAEVLDSEVQAPMSELESKIASGNLFAELATNADAQPTPEPELATINDAEDATEATEAQQNAASDGVDETERSRLASVVSMLSEVGAKLENESEPNVLEHSFDVITQVTDTLETWVTSENAGFARVCELAEDANDTIQLLCVEANDNSSLDAVSTLLQVKREAQRLLVA